MDWLDKSEEGNMDIDNFGEFRNPEDWKKELNDEQIDFGTFCGAVRQVLEASHTLQKYSPEYDEGNSELIAATSKLANIYSLRALEGRTK